MVEDAGWNGVFAGRLLADAGADVVRIVGPGGDPLDREPPFFGASDGSIQAAWYNAGKRLVPIDTGSAAARGQYLDLLSGADILIEDWPAAARWPSVAEIGAMAPRLARISVTATGREGPWASLKVNDLVANALSGSPSVTGGTTTPPLSGYGNQSHHTAGLYAAICALAALRAAKATGRAQHIDLSAHEAVASCTEQVLMEWFFPEGPWKTATAPRQGALHWSGMYDIYPAADDVGVMVSIALGFHNAVLPWMVEDGAAQDLTGPDYATPRELVQHLPHAMQVVREWVAGKRSEPFMFEAQRRHQPFGAVWDIAKALQSPQIAARGYFQEQDVDGAGRQVFPGRFFRSDADGPHPAPAARVSVREVGWDGRPPQRATEGDANATAPLAGIRIIDFTHVLAGPFGTRVLGDLGAEVFRVATAARSGGSNSPGHPYYVSWNRNKRSVTINMAMEEGRASARRLAARCDALIENFSAGVLKRWGMDRAAMAATNPGLTVVSMGGMGQDGPWKDWVTFAPTIHALTGLSYLTNFPHTRDLGYGFSLTDHLSGLAGALAILEGVEHRERTGRGIEVDLSQYELGLGIMAPALMDYLSNGTNPEPVGNRHPFGAWAPHGIYRCEGEDRWVAVAVRGDNEWAALCRVMAREEFVADPRFATHGARMAHQDELDAAMEDWTRTRDRYGVMDACQAAGIAAGAVQDARDLATRDPQTAARGFFGTATSPTRGEYGIDRFPALFNGRRPDRYEAVHEIGEDTFDVLTQVAGFDAGEVADLIAMGALS